MADEILLRLSRDEALVLFDWLVRSREGGEPAGLVDQTEQRVFWDIEADLETQLTETFAADYRARLHTARGRIRDIEG